MPQRTRKKTSRHFIDVLTRKVETLNFGKIKIFRLPRKYSDLKNKVNRKYQFIIDDTIQQIYLGLDILGPKRQGLNQLTV